MEARAPKTHTPLPRRIGAANLLSMLSKKLLPIVATCMIGTTLSTHAALVLNLDTDAKEFFFTGTDSVVRTGSEVVWTTSGSGALTSYDITSSIDITGNTSFSNLLQLGSSRSLLFFEFVFISGEPNFAGNGGRLSYASATPDQAAFLEGLAGSSIPLTQGIGGSPVEVQIIPEPSAPLLISIAALGSLYFRRRSLS